MTELEKRVEQLRQRFLGGLAGRLASLDESWAHATEGDDENVRRMLHSLAGTAATYKLSALAAVAREAEDALEDGERVRAAASIDRLRQLMQEYAACA